MNIALDAGFFRFIGNEWNFMLKFKKYKIIKQTIQWNSAKGLFWSWIKVYMFAWLRYTLYRGIQV